jgi:hypothetical protein
MLKSILRPFDGKLVKVTVYLDGQVKTVEGLLRCGPRIGNYVGIGDKYVAVQAIQSIRQKDAS